MAYQTATLTGTYQLWDGSPASGTIDVIPNSPVLIDAEGDVVLSGRLKVDLDETGSFSVTLPATDDTTVEPATGRQYAVSARLRHQGIAAVTGIELAGGETVDMADITSAPETVAALSVWLTQEEYDAVVARVDALDAALGTLTAASVGADPAGTAAAAVAALQAATLRAVKGANETASNTITTHDDSALTVPLAANAVYEIEAFVRYESSTTADFRLGLTAPEGATATWSGLGASNAVSTGGIGTGTFQDRDVSQTSILGGAGAGAPLVARIMGAVTTGATAGDLKVRWAQSIAEVSDTKVLAGSRLKATRV